ncbi:MAG: hypothetical protein HW412_463 [Bacteroidetes bacterium]|nr:hypothetical protein [Bacteroidota bacterium]
MNWKLIFQLSLLGLAMAIATVSWIPSNIEPFFWLVIFIICSYLIATKCEAKHFLHGFMVSIFNSIWITAIHVIFFDTYMANHPEMAQMNTSMPMADSPRLMMVIMGPVFGAAFGLILGLFAFIASKIIKRPNP